MDQQTLFDVPTTAPAPLVQVRFFLWYEKDGERKAYWKPKQGAYGQYMYTWIPLDKLGRRKINLYISYGVAAHWRDRHTPRMEGLMINIGQWDVANNCPI